MAKLSEILRSVEGGYILWCCPGCNMAHQIRTQPTEAGTSGWSWNGDAEKPTFYPSVLVRGTQQLTDREVEILLSGGEVIPRPLVCHSFVVDGQMQFLDDCTHEMAGQTVPIPPFNPDDEP